MKCPICSGALKQIFTTVILHKHQGLFDHCEDCGFLRVRDPDWLEEAYSSAIAAADTGLVARNNHLSTKIASLLYFVFNERGDGVYLDAAGGYGMLTRLMRDIGFDFYWSDQYCANILARGFEYSQEIGACSAVTAIEVMEHLINPLEFVDEVLSFAKSDTLIFTTELYSGKPPKPEEWWYYSLATGQHIGFFNRKTLELLGGRLNLNFYSANGVHIFTRKTLRAKLMHITTQSKVSLGLAILLKKRLNSKTMGDHKQMLCNNQNK